MKGKRFKYIAGLAALLLVICLFRSCCNALLVASREEFVSPRGTNTVVIEYDHVCRPYVYQKTWYGKREIWTYPKGGFMETVSFGVEWLSENQFRMTSGYRIMVVRQIVALLMGVRFPLVAFWMGMPRGEVAMVRWTMLSNDRSGA